MKKQFYTFIFLVIFIFSKSQWVATNLPSGVYPFSLTIKNDMLVLGTLSHGIYISTDKGQTWTQKNNGISAISTIQAVAVIDNDIFATMSGGKIYRSVDNGDNWVLSNTNIASTTIVMNMAKFDDKIFAGTTNKGIYVSSDNGNTWAQNNSGISGLVASGLMPTDTDLFTGIIKKVYKYNASNNTWTDSSSSVFPNAAVSAFTWFKDDLGNKKLYAGFGASSNMVARSLDNGTTWETASTNLPNVYIYTMASFGKVVFAGNEYGVYYSSDSGNTWNSGNEGFLNTYSASWLTTGTDYLYVLQGAKVWKRKYSDFGITLSVNEMLSESSKMRNYPNPFRDKTIIEYFIKNSSSAKLSVADVLGRELCQINLGNRLSGKNTYEYNAEKYHLKSGIYYYKIITNYEELYGKMIVK